MPFYDSRAVYADPILTNFSLGYQDQTFIGPSVLPWTPTALPSGRYRVFNRDDWVTFPARREPGTSPNEVRGYKWSEDTFSTKQYALKAAITDEEEQNIAAAAANPQADLLAGINAAEAATKLITRSIAIQYELQVSTMVRNTANNGASATLAGGTQWSAGGTSDPMGNIITGLQSVYTLTLQEANLMIIPYPCWITLANHPTLLARFQYVQPQYDVEAAINLFTGFNGTILVPNVVYNTADNIDATPAMSNIWGKDVWIGKVDATVGQNTQTYGKTFYQPVNGQRQAIFRYRDEDRMSDMVRIKCQYDLKVCAPNAGYVIKAAVA